MNSVEAQIAMVLPDIFDTPRKQPTDEYADIWFIPEGQRNATLTRLGGGMRRNGFSVEAITDALRTENSRRCRPPLSEFEVIAVARSVGRYHTASTARRHSFAVLDDVALLSRPNPPQLVDGRIPAQSLGALVGAAESLKTFIALGLSGSVLRGAEWHGAPVRRGSALLVAAEGATGLKARISALKRSYGMSPEEPLGLHIVDEPVNLYDVAEVDRFIDDVVAPRAPLDILTIDTLARCSAGMDENSAKDMGLVVRSADRIRDAARGVVLLTHHVNAAETKERGSSALRGACDFILRTSRTDDHVCLSCDKQKDMEPFGSIKLKLVPVPGTDSAVVRLASEVLPGADLSGAQRSLLTALWDAFGAAGATTKDWQDAVPEVARRTFFRAKRVLVERGDVRRQAGRFVPQREL